MSISTADEANFQVGMDIVIGPGTPTMEFNKIRAFGTIELTTPLLNNHPKGTKVSKKTAADTTTAQDPCAPKTTTTKKDPCAADAPPFLKKFETSNKIQSQSVATNRFGLFTFGFGGFVAVSLAMFAFVARFRHTQVSSETSAEELECEDLERLLSAP